MYRSSYVFFVLLFFIMPSLYADQPEQQAEPAPAPVVDACNSLVFQGTPDGASITIDEGTPMEQACLSPCRIEKIAEGEHTVHYTKIGYRSKKRLLTVTGCKEQTVPFLLELSEEELPTNGDISTGPDQSGRIAPTPQAITTLRNNTLSFSGVPTNTLVTIDKGSPEEQSCFSPCQITNITDGEHAVSYEQEGFQEKKEPVTVQGNRAKAIAFTLEFSEKAKREARESGVNWFSVFGEGGVVSGIGITFLSGRFRYLIVDTLGFEVGYHALLNSFFFAADCSMIGPKFSFGSIQQHEIGLKLSPLHFGVTFVRKEGERYIIHEYLTASIYYRYTINDNLALITGVTVPTVQTTDFKGKVTVWDEFPNIRGFFGVTY